MEKIIVINGENSCHKLSGERDDAGLYTDKDVQKLLDDGWSVKRTEASDGLFLVVLEKN